MKFSEEVKTTLWSMIDQMSTNLSQFIVNPEKDFSRKKKWDFPTLMKFIISMEGQSLKNELHKYFGYTLECPSNSSFNQRRSQVKADAFKYLFNSFTSNYNKTAKLFKGYKLLACDGSDINIPHNSCDEETYFQQGTAKGFNQLHLNAMYDLMNRIYIDIVIQPARTENEHAAFCEMVDGYNGSEKTIFIVDRGYESYNNLAHVIEKGAFFLFRCKDINSNGIVAFSKDKLPNKDEFDTNISLILTRKWTKEILNNRDKYRHFRNNDTFDYLDLTEHIFYHMNLRVLRFKISEEDYECILTNLSQNEFSANEIKKLYAMRWGIETSFREEQYEAPLAARQIRLSSIQRNTMIGHLLGAAGGVEFIVCVKSILDGYIHQTMGTKNVDPECDLNYAVGSPIEKDVNYVLTNSLGFGGHNASLLVKKYEDEGRV